MKLVMTLLVRDEEDIVEDHLVYHLNQGVDFVVATDNKSVDGTRDVLDRFQRLGYVEVIDEPDDTYDQWRWVTRMARRAAIEHGADWVINSDADELWWPKSGDLRSVLEAVPARYGIVTAPRVNLVPPLDPRPAVGRRAAVVRAHGAARDDVAQQPGRAAAAQGVPSRRARRGGGAGEPRAARLGADAGAGVAPDRDLPCAAALVVTAGEQDGEGWRGIRAQPGAARHRRRCVAEPPRPARPRRPTRVVRRPGARRPGPPARHRGGPLHPRPPARALPRNPGPARATVP
ncbi:MAG: hypothetical protein E6G06_07650 [Actinobacteria bacterium]|nr:MAG: hypothetical protein E6G06_07650 [Actinomycetota bacterium]